jgi:predicted LPLAT superfamily acyltransferase
MQERFYGILIFLSKIFGDWVFIILSRGVGAGFFLFSHRKRATGVRFYRALFPDRRLAYHLGCTWKQFQSFTSVFLERYRLEEGAPPPFGIAGKAHLVRAMQAKKGGIILMSHMGNWEIAARLLRESLPDLELMLFMGERTRDEIERLQKRDLMANGIRVIAAGENRGSPFDLVEGIRFLRSGGFVSMSGDRRWREDQRTVRVRFLGHTANLPEAPHVLALLSGTPLFFFFARSRNGRHHFSISPPVFVKAETGKRRSPAVSESARRYAEAIETHLRRSPFEWYHFEPFLEVGGQRTEVRSQRTEVRSQRTEVRGQ